MLVHTKIIIVQAFSCVFTTVSISKLRNPKHREVTKTRRKRRIQKKVSMLKVSILALRIIMIISLKRIKEKKTKQATTLKVTTGRS